MNDSRFVYDVRGSNDYTQHRYRLQQSARAEQLDTRTLIFLPAGLPRTFNDPCPAFFEHYVGMNEMHDTSCSCTAPCSITNARFIHYCRKLYVY